MEFIAALNEIASRIGLGAFEPDESGSVTLLFDGEHEVSFVPDGAEGVVYFQSEIADAGALREGECRALLEASLSGANGAAFAINRQLGKVLIWKRYGEFASGAVLEKEINEFLGQAIRWKRRLAEGAGGDIGGGGEAGSFGAAGAAFDGGGGANAGDAPGHLGFMMGSFIQV